MRDFNWRNRYVGARFPRTMREAGMGEWGTAKSTWVRDALVYILLLVLLVAASLLVAVEPEVRAMPRVEVKPAADPVLLCEHYKLTGRGYLCKTT